LEIANHARGHIFMLGVLKNPEADPFLQFLQFFSYYAHRS